MVANRRERIYKVMYICADGTWGEGTIEASNAGDACIMMFDRVKAVIGDGESVTVRAVPEGQRGELPDLVPPAGADAGMTVLPDVPVPAENVELGNMPGATREDPRRSAMGYNSRRDPESLDHRQCP